ncbi:sigma-54-dependent transcriptional regulator [Rhizobium oryzicola]|uniref:Sigma-54 dependent transcriptional regulator n=1 Tax=Rhizobium oryzicola TaxID=1232668 RepID=A0ABT8SPM5_9HYPH|nr:sigma-54 dependent transcriptional regulator [Rhizobium oryzicola]MDO1580484.1 sigma-54 dependent transcriptional regulator [Rhizobium oryzicola]
MNLSGTVFLVDDDSALRKAMCQTLELGGLTVVNFPSAAQALAQVNADLDGILITDVLMPGMTGLELFDHVRAIDPDLPVILITGHGDIPMAVEALRRGAYDFIAKPFPAERMLESARRALEKRRLVLENRRLKEASFDDTLPLIGQTPVMERLRNTIRQIADTNVDVLLTGETGSGKEVVASLLHRWSRRAKGNFVALNCGALPEQIMESELFGHETGAFTGAQKKRIGRIEYSSGGTLFLDEIESMPASTQVQMLRVLEMREVTPLGTNEVRPVDLRVVAAAKVDLGDPAQRRDFREDLYYRLNVVALSIPPLRERREDVSVLFAHFCHRAGQRFGREIPDLSPSVTRHLAEHDWPGNVRELSHFAERFVLGLEGQPEPQAPPRVLLADAAGSLPDRLAKLEAEIIRETLSRHGGDVRQTIEELGIPRKTFYDKLQRHGIVRGEFAGKPL